MSNQGKRNLISVSGCAGMLPKCGSPLVTRGGGDRSARTAKIPQTNSTVGVRKKLGEFCLSTRQHHDYLTDLGEIDILMLIVM